MAEYINKIGEETNVLNDNIAFVYHYDFSRANTNDTSRVEAITTVASICYDNPNVIGKESLYNRLKAEAMGLPSSSFEFVPVLLSVEKFKDIYEITQSDFEKYDTMNILNIERYGEWIKDEFNESYLLTNYRALLRDWENLSDEIKLSLYESDNFSMFFNNEKECDIIKANCQTFLYKMDLSTSKQHNRHRVSLQELSRRYVSGKKTAFEFYISDKMKMIESVVSSDALTTMCVDHYFSAIDAGVQPQEARRILPQSMYTTIWSSFLPFQLENYLSLRDDNHAQYEIQMMAQAMKRLLKKK